MAGMANRFRRDRTVIFKVGERELHVVEYRRDGITGQENIYVDGNIVLRSVTIAVRRGLRVFELFVGDRETHAVRIEARRLPVLRGILPTTCRVFVDNQLMNTYQG